MALTKAKKQEIIDEVSSLLARSKMTVIATYTGTGVKSMQELRRNARDNGTVVHVLKNRLVKQAMQKNETLKDADLSLLTGQLLYAFNSEDEAAPAQSLAAFAKSNSTLEFVGAFSADGTFLEAKDVTSLASLPPKQVLRAQLVGTLAAPLSGFVNVLSGNVRGVMNVLTARAEAIK